ncbi:MAG: trypsin-like peptidase domain-containing protein, partial [Pirellulales bacterium]
MAAVAELEKTLVEVIAEAQPCVVAITRTAPPQANANQSVVIIEAFGDLQQVPSPEQAETVAAGVLIDPAGLVLTEFLAVRPDDTHSVTLPSGETYPAEIKAADPRSGLAVLAIQPAVSARQRTGESPRKTPTSFPAIHFGNADQLRKGQFVISIGNPYAIRSDGEPTASWGIVANLARKAPPGTNFNDAAGPSQDYRTSLHHLGTLIQTDAKLGWSAGGGALVNLRGELVGLTTTVATIAGHEQPAGYAIPINATFRRIIDTLKEGREVEYGLLGVSLGMGISTGGNVAEPRVIVQHAYVGSPGELAGLKAGDVILGVGGKPVRDVDQLQLSVSLLPPSTDTTIEYVRGSNRAQA